MTNDPLAVACLVVSCALLAVLYARSGRQGLMFYSAAFFALFAFGPVVNYLLGSSIYQGIHRDLIGKACLGFTLALSGLTLADLFAGSRLQSLAGRTGFAPAPRQFLVQVPLLIIATAYGVVVSLTLLPLYLAGSKAQSVQAAGALHHIYLLFEVALVSTYFITHKSSWSRRLWYANAGTYVIYCLFSYERDFLFVLFSVLIHQQVLLRGRRVSWRVVVGGVVSLLAASVLFATRAGQRLDLTGVLNQGSILFIDTFVMSDVPSRESFRHGSTYWDSLVSLPPYWLYDSGGQTLSRWLVDIYAPGTRAGGGYGFSLSGEAYLNFGLVGIFITFLVLGLVQRLLAAKATHSDWTLFISVYYTAVLMYAMRGDSSQLLKSMAYGSVFFAVVWALSISGEHRRRSRVLTRSPATSIAVLKSGRADPKS